MRHIRYDEAKFEQWFFSNIIFAYEQFLFYTRIQKIKSFCDKRDVT